jgi:hypothetical protein
MFAMASNSIRPHSRIRRSSRPAAMATAGADTAASTPGIAIVKPAVPSETPNVEPIEVNRPIGRISAVTMAKMPIATQTTANQPSIGDLRASRRALVVEDVVKIDIHQANNDRRAIAGGFQPRPTTGDLRPRVGSCCAGRPRGRTAWDDRPQV